ncbi:MAG: RNA-protein complex protein Nop10 [Candidatus Korarchaeota archaeon]|nr:RNA-protein complex protein Nop10 [Candidatus Korarchaeota archaeon]NIU83620.1 RNA-protein complex protein Nop10 [Candidatus Thorarchaeota archaeon]NIW14128.1 RNA-protein complex protein Nop10 [Candidatus Thorarchaeota archaeon]NIW52235.1 RNA-protein complex protein Nop10 [Candidatus Korarchaeota archaeon]
MAPKLIYRCTNCHKYTLESDVCPYCGGDVRTAHPPPFSHTDKWGEYRRKAKKRLEEHKKGV